MIKICCREYYGRTLLTVEGHSGFDTRGNDIVCAGVSALVGALLNTMLDEESNGRLSLQRNIIRDGYLYLEIEKFDFSRERTEGIIDGFVTGFMMLAEAYPDYVVME